MKIFSLFFFVSLFFLALSALPASAFVSGDVTSYPVESKDFPQKTFNNLVYDAKIPSNAGSSDVLQALTLYQYGSARDLFDIASVTLWADDAYEVGFQGYGVDRNLGNFSWNGSCNCYSISDLNETIPLNGLRIFVSLQTATGVTSGRNIQLSLMKLDDKDKDGEFDLGETGVFLQSSNDGPTNAPVDNVFLQRVVTVTRDSYPPLAVINNLYDNQKLNDKSYTITGVAQDNGGSFPQKVQVGIDGVYFDVTSTGENFSTWSYAWENIADGEHILTVIAEDYNFNSATMSRVLDVSVDFNANEISATKSSVSVTESLMDVDISISLLTKEEKPYKGADILAVYSSGSQFEQRSRVISDSDGRAQFRIYGKEEGASSAKIYAIQTNGKSVLLGIYDFTFQEDDIGVPTDVFVELILRTDLSKKYFVRDGVYHLFPSDEVFYAWGYQDSELIEATSFFSEWESGSVMKFPDGTLIKGSEAAVSVVTNSGKRAWIKDEVTFLGLGYRWSDIHVISDSELALYTRIDDITTNYKHPNGTLIKYQTDAKTYFIDNGMKRWITSEEVFYDNDWSFQDVIIVPDTEAYTTGEPIDDDIREDLVL